MTVSNKNIKDKLDKVFIEKFGCSADKVEMLKEHRFLSSKIGFLLELFLEVEKEFGITFSKDEILSTQFDDYTELVEGISKKLGGE